MDLSNSRVKHQGIGNIIIPQKLDDSYIVTIEGKKENIDQAIRDINDLIKDLDKKVLIEVFVEKKYHPFIKSQITNLQDKFSGVKINIPPLGSNFDRICLNGENTSMAMVKPPSPG